MKSYHIRGPKCNNNHSFYRYGKDSNGYQKYLCRNCHHQFAPERPRSEGANCRRKHPPRPVCGKASFLHHDYEHYSNYRCTDKKCNHSFFVWKSATVTAPSMSTLFGKHNFKRMRYPVQIIITALSMFYLGKNSFRNISLILKTAFNIKVSHTTVSNWCVKFAPLFDDMRIQLVSLLDLNSDEWHADEAVSLFSEAVKLGKPSAVVSDRYSAYKVPVKSIFDGAKHIRVQSFKDDISNNLIECFNKQFKAWYKTKQGFSSFESANNLISLFVFFFNFVRPHSALNGLTPAQVAGLNLSKRRKREFLLVA